MSDTSEMSALRELARLAATKHIQGRSFKRNSLLDPFARMLENLEHWPDAKDREYVRAMLKDEVSVHIERASLHGLSRERREAIHVYVDCFFDRLLDGEHHGIAQRLLERERLLKGAYLIFFREAMPASQRIVADDAAATGEEIEPIDEP